MENQDQQPIKNDENSHHEQHPVNQSKDNVTDPSGKENEDEKYTEDEIPFADGEGTQLNEAIDKQEDSDEDND
ncbi:MULTISPECIES: hypothetical protein [Pedobacter]|uniref:hypothetical protein n=1 Tax=Pedobacter TaxID=84567 RepID=UPI001E2B5540|nr:MULTISPECIES: hypothetical protein [Pedobacter]